MEEIMEWDICLKEHIKKVQRDNEKIKSIQKMCNARLRVINGMEIDDETASIAATDYYEVIKELLVALLLQEGIKSDNHECLISFFKYKFPQYDYEVKMMHQLKNIRNRASYDGVFVKKEYIINNKLEFEHIIKIINKLLGET